MPLFVKIRGSRGRLLVKYEVPKKTLIPHYKNQEAKSIAPVIERLQKGESLALVSDAGTPGISDPGYYLVSEVVKAGFTVEPIPGSHSRYGAVIRFPYSQ